MNTFATDSTGRMLLARYYQAMLDKNADALADLYAEHAIHEFPLLSPFFPQRLDGRDAIRKHYAAVWGASPIRIVEMHEKAVYETQDPYTIIGEAEYTAEAQPTGTTFTLSFLVVLKTEGGLILHLRDYMDALGAAFALNRLSYVVDALAQRAR